MPNLGALGVRRYGTNARLSVVSGAQVIYAAATGIRSPLTPPSFSCFPGTCHNEHETVVSSNTSHTAGATTEIGVPERQLGTPHSASLSCPPDSLGRSSMVPSNSSFFIVETLKTFQRNKSL